MEGGGARCAQTAAEAQRGLEAGARAGEATPSQGQGVGGSSGAARSSKKSPGHLGGRGRRHGAEERRMIIQLIDEAVQAGARREKATALLGLSSRAVAR